MSSILRRLAGLDERSAVKARSAGYESIPDAVAAAAASTGERVTFDTAMGLAAVWSAITLLAETIGTLPLIVYQRRTGGGRVRAWYDPAYRLLHDRPNPVHTPTDLKSLAVGHLLTYGNAYWAKVFDAQGRLIELWPVRPDRVRVRLADGQPRFTVRDAQGRLKDYDAATILHFKGFSFGGITGLAPIDYARNAIGGALKRQETQDRLSANRSIPSGFLTTDASLTDEQKTAMGRQIEAKWKGPRNAGRIPILDEGLRFQAVSLPPDQAQYVEMMRFSVQDIARIFRVPPEMIGGDSGSSLTYTTAETSAIKFLTHSVRPWLVRIEETLAADPDLFPTGTLFPEFLADALLRTETRARVEAYSIAVGKRPWMHPSEVRSRENLEPDDSFDALPVPGAPLVEVKQP